MGEAKVNKKVKLTLPFYPHEAVRDLKMSIAGLEHHIDNCDDLDAAHYFVDRIRGLFKKAEAKRDELKEKKL